MHGPGSPQPAPVPVDDASLHHAVREVLRYAADEEQAGGPDGLARACVEAYRDAAVAERRPTDPLSVWREVWDDLLFRHAIVRLAERHARVGRTPLYAMEFSHTVRPPYFGTPHTSDSKFLRHPRSAPARWEVRRRPRRTAPVGRLQGHRGLLRQELAARGPRAAVVAGVHPGPAEHPHPGRRAPRRDGPDEQVPAAASWDDVSWVPQP